MNYRQHPSLNFSLAKHLLDSPAHFKKAKDATPKEPSKAFEIGTLAHAVILENKPLETICACKPEGLNLTTKDGKAWKAEQTLPIVSLDEYLDIMGMAQSVRDNPTAMQCLNNAPLREHAIYGDMHGVECKALLDAAGAGFIADLKTCNHSDPRGFAWHVEDFHYDLQLAWYSTLYAMTTNSETPPFWVWIAVEKTAPYTCVVYKGEEHYQNGMEKLERVLALYKECTASGKWPQPYQGLQELKPVRRK